MIQLSRDNPYLSLTQIKSKLKEMGLVEIWFKDCEKKVY